jgi:MFS family permease
LIVRRTVVLLGVSQLVCWGISYYLVAVFGDAIGAELGWSRSVVHGGFSVALLIMALSSRLAGALIDRHGGRGVMAAGSVLTALGCGGLALAHTIAAYYAAWACLGLAMRLTLYDAAFATLARIGGPGANQAMSRITLLGGLASTTFWPIGHALAARLGWRGALGVYVGFALLTIPLHLAIPGGRHEPVPASGATERAPLAHGPRDRWIAASLYALILTLVAFLNSAMSAHMIGILTAFGLTASASVWIATLRGIGQSSARLAEVLSGSRLHPLVLNVVASAVLPVSFVAGLASGRFIVAAAAFALLYGAGNGISTIARGTLPLVLFDYRSYGAIVGRLLVPSFVVSAVAPFAYALVIERFGEASAMLLSLAVATAALAAGVALHVRFGRQT